MRKLKIAPHLDDLGASSDFGSNARAKEEK